VQRTEKSHLPLPTEWDRTSCQKYEGGQTPQKDERKPN